MTEATLTETPYYKTIDGYFDWEHLYDEIADMLPEGGAFVEIGCWRGQSLAYMLCRLKELGKTVQVVGVDHFKGSLEENRLANIAAREDIESQCRKNLAGTLYPHGVLACKSVEAAAEFADGHFDCIFIDGSHDKASVVADLQAWMPKLKPGGLLAGHDINQAGVEQALTEVLSPTQRAQVKESPRPQELGGFRWGLCWTLQT